MLRMSCACPGGSRGVKVCVCSETFYPIEISLKVLRNIQILKGLVINKENNVFKDGIGV